jgi:hypothetical protein
MFIIKWTYTDQNIPINLLIVILPLIINHLALLEILEIVTTEAEGTTEVQDIQGTTEVQDIQGTTEAEGTTEVQDIQGTTEMVVIENKQL